MTTLKNIPVTDALRLAPGTYFLSVDLPEAVLDALLLRSSFLLDAASRISAHAGHSVDLSGGVTWGTVPGSNQTVRYLGLKLVIPEPDTGEVAARALVAPVVIALSVVVSALALAIGAAVTTKNIFQILQVMPEQAAEDLAKGFLISARTAAGFAAVGAVAGLLYYLERYGVLE